MNGGQKVFAVKSLFVSCLKSYSSAWELSLNKKNPPRAQIFGHSFLITINKPELNFYRIKRFRKNHIIP